MDSENENVLQLRLKREQVRAQFAWYEEMLNDDQMPLIDDTLLAAHYYAAADPTGTLNVYLTSGTSSGRRKRIRYSAAEERFYLDEKARLFAQLLADETGHVPYRTAVADMGTGHAAATAADIFQQIGLTCHSLPFSLPIAEHLTVLERERPQVLYTMPSILERLLFAAPDPMAFGLRKVILVGEVCTPAWRAQMAGRLQLEADDIVDTYGSIEIGTIAYFCNKISRYVLMDGLIAERLRDGHDVAEDECVLVLTALHRTHFPALRYVTNDVVRDLQMMEVDGRQRMTFAALTRRIGDEFKHGEKISLYDIEQTVCTHVADAVIRVVLREGRKMCVFVRSSETLSEQTRARIADDLAQRIAEIGEMIGNGLLSAIVVEQANEADEWFADGARKLKKIWR
jgi:phenylacetate-coenzyme A ligase PaaK-like adenylate-forming protein